MFEIGELRNQLSLDLQRRLVAIRDHWASEPNYFLLIHSDRLDESTDFTRIVRIRQPNREKIPIQKIFGAMLLYVDNRKGSMDVIWNLPLDIPTDPRVKSEEMVPEVAESAKDLGLRF